MKTYMMKLSNSPNFLILDQPNYDEFKGRRLTLAKNGYAVFRRNKKLHLLHRYVMGEPKGTIHHINGNKLDNRKENLEVFGSENEHILHENRSKLGFHGSSFQWDKRVDQNKPTKSWKVELRYKGKRSYLYFIDPISAEIIYDCWLNEVKRLHGGE